MSVLPTCAAPATSRPGSRSRTVPVTVPESFLPSGVHTAPSAPQSVVAASTTVTGASDAGSTVSVHARLVRRPSASSCSLSMRTAAVTSPFVTSSTCATMSAAAIATASLKRTAKVNGASPCCLGTSVSRAVSTDAGPGTTALRFPTSGRPSEVHTAPCAAQSVVSGSSTVTASSENESTVMCHSRFGWSPCASSCTLSRRRAATTSPLVTSNTCAIMPAVPIATASLNTTSKVKGLLCIGSTLRSCAVSGRSIPGRLLTR